MRMRARWWAVVVGLAAGVLVAQRAEAHELGCDARVEGALLFEARSYPVTLDYALTVKNAHATDASEVLAAQSSVLSQLGVSFSPAPPFTLDKGASVTSAASVAVASYERCLELAAKDGVADRYIDDVFSASWDLGAAQCRTRVVCKPPTPTPPEECPADGGSLKVCGRVDAFAAATQTLDGYIVLDGKKYLILAGTRLDGEALVKVGLVFCLNVGLQVDANAVAKIKRGAVTASLDVALAAKLKVCGKVQAYQAATLGSAGYVVLDGAKYLIDAGAQLTGQELIKVGAELCLDVEVAVAVDLSLRISKGSVALKADACAGAAVSLCGVVSLFQKATATLDGLIVIGGVRHVIAAGTHLLGEDTVKVGAVFCLKATAAATVSGALRIVSGTITADAGADGLVDVSVCGQLTLFVAATAASDGVIVIGGQSWLIAAGTTLDGQASLELLANVCLSASARASVAGTLKLVAGTCAAN